MSVLIRGSEVQDFLRCRLRWDYAWRKHLVPKTQNDKLFIGTLIHRFLEEWYVMGRNFQVASNAMERLFYDTDTSGMEQTEIDELWELARRVAANYHDTYYEKDQSIQVLATELTFRIKINDKVTYTGTVDLVGIDQDGALFFMDHKTTSSLEKYEKNAVMDRQISRYWWALNTLCAGKGEILVNNEWVPVVDTVLWANPTGEHLHTKSVSYFIYNVILKDYPVPPKVLKKGDLSKDKAQKTTYALYMQEIERLGLNPESYSDFLEYLKDNPRRFFSRVEVRRNAEEIRNAMKDFYDTALDMGNNPRIYRNVTTDCAWDCAFRDVCIAGFDGSNVDLLLNTLYTRREEETYDAAK